MSELLSDTPATLFIWDATHNAAAIAWALRGGSRKTDIVAPLVKPAELKGYARFSLLGKDYPAPIKHDETSIDRRRLLLCFQDKSQRKRLHNFEGEVYVVTPVQVTASQRSGGRGHILVGWRTRCNLGGPLGFGCFIRERLDDWIEIFAGSGR